MLLCTDLGPQCGPFNDFENLSILAETGYTGIDFSFFLPGKHGPAADTPEHLSYLKTLRAHGESLGLAFVQGHAPMPSSTSDPAETEEIFQDIVRSLRNAQILGVGEVVVHPLDHWDLTVPENEAVAFLENLAFYRRLEPFCRQYQVKIAIENICQKPRGNKYMRSITSTPDRLIRLLDTLNSPWFVACLDTGHAALVCEDPGQFARALGSRLRALHVHDCTGLEDSHTLPFLGVIRWDLFASALRDVGFPGPFTFESGNFVGPYPKELKKSALLHQAAVGKYFIEKIEG